MNNIINNFWWFINPYYWWKWYFISFVEEGILNPDYKGYIGGRVEIWTQLSQYDIDEWRFLTKDQEGYSHLREKYDFKNMSWFELRRFKKKVNKFYEQKY